MATNPMYTVNSGNQATPIMYPQYAGSTRYIPTGADVIPPTAHNRPVRYVPPAQVATRQSGTAKSKPRRQITDTEGQTASTAPAVVTPVPAPVPAVAKVAAQVAAQPQAAVGGYVPPQGLQVMRQSTPCERGEGGCGDPVTSSSNLAAWELNPNAPLSLLSQLHLAPKLQQIATQNVAASQAGAAQLYDQSLQDPRFQATVQANRDAGMPEATAVANARYVLTGSMYAQNLYGSPAVIRATDGVESQNRAAAAATNATYAYNNNASNGYVPSVSMVNPSTGEFTINNGQHTNTGFSGPSTNLAVGTIEGGVPAWSTEARAGINAVGAAAQADKTAQVKQLYKMEEETLKANSAYNIAQLRAKAAKEAAEAKEAAKTGAAAPVIIDLQ